MKTTKNGLHLPMRVVSILTAALIAVGGLGMFAAPDASAATGTGIANLAYAQIGKVASSAKQTPSHFGDSNLAGHSNNNWCADFVKWVWQNSGVNVNGINGLASSVYTAAVNKTNGSVAHTASSYVPQPGDAIVFKTSANGSFAHVAIVYSSYSNGKIDIINGSSGKNNVDIQRNQNGRVGQTAEGMYIQSFVTPGGLTPAIQSRIAVISTSNVASIKEGGVGSAWSSLYSNAKQVVMDGNRIGVLTTSGNAYVKEGTLQASWTLVATSVKEMAINGNRIMVLWSSGTASIKEGSVGATWTTLMSNVKQLAITQNRIGLLTNAGQAYVKEGALSNGWVLEATAVSQLSLAGTRIGILCGNSASVKEGSMYATWTLVSTGVKQLAMSGNRIGILGGTSLSIKEGPINAVWTTVATGVSQFSLSGNRIGIVCGSTASIKEGPINAVWTKVATSVKNISLYTVS